MNDFPFYTYDPVADTLTTRFSSFKKQTTKPSSEYEPGEVLDAYGAHLNDEDACALMRKWLAANYKVREIDQAVCNSVRPALLRCLLESQGEDVKCAFDDTSERMSLSRFFEHVVTTVEDYDRFVELVDIILERDRTVLFAFCWITVTGKITIAKKFNDMWRYFQAHRKTHEVSAARFQMFRDYLVAQGMKFDPV
jgi:hypothetical protein